MGPRWPLLLVRKKFSIVLLSTLGLTVLTVILFSVRIPGGESRLDLMERRLLAIQLKMEYVQKLYQARQLELYTFENRLDTNGSRDIQNCRDSKTCIDNIVGATPKFIAQLKNLNGTYTYEGFTASYVQPLSMPPISYELLPHLLNDNSSLIPLFNVRGRRYFVDVVIGLPTVKRAKENYLMITLTHLVERLSPEEEQSTLIVVYVGESDPVYVMNTTLQIESAFFKHIQSGLIEILAAPASYYPDFKAMTPTLGDSKQRFDWRTKQNLDNIFLMTYCQNRGTFYLMMEDDVIARNNYIREIKRFTLTATMSKPNWIVIEFCRIGGIGKLFRSRDLVYFITYIQIFYANMPIDWLIESYLFDRVCTIEKKWESMH